MDRFSGRSFFRRSRPAAFAFSDILLVLLPLALMASFFYGVRALFVLGIAVTTALVTEALGCFLMKKEIPKGDWSPVVTGLILGPVSYTHLFSKRRSPTASPCSWSR